MSLNSYLIAGARPFGEDVQDIRIIGGRIAEIGIGLDPENLGVVRAEGRVALPSFVDLHTHLREPGREDAETIASGSRAATLGGFRLYLPWQTQHRLPTRPAWSSKCGELVGRPA